ncbi:MAG: hypothetical protein ACXAE3_17825 [Candidatus Kariarchaeaceae archaeon]|jgi:hypothetical protein
MKAGVFGIAASLVMMSLMVVSINAAITPMTVDLVAGKNTVVGSVTVTNDDTNVYVTYTTFDDWFILETHLHLAADFDGFPTAGNNNPKVGRFDYGDSFSVESETQSVTYTFDISEMRDSIGLPGDEDCFLIAAHAVVARVVDGEIEDEETAWGDGDRFTQRGSWAMYFEYCLQEDDDPPTGDETAYGLSLNGDETCFLDIDDGNGPGEINRWGWSNGPYDPYERFDITYELWAGAADCDTEKGTLVGTVTLFYDNREETLDVTYNVDAPYTLLQVHIHVGFEYLPRLNGDLTSANGQFLVVESSLGGVSQYSTTINDPGLTESGTVEDFYIVTHAKVGGF